MFALTKLERSRRRYKRDVRRLVTSIFCLSGGNVAAEDRVWSTYLKTVRHKGGHYGLRDLLKSDVTNVFKERALAVLLAPSHSWSPFEWIEDGNSTYLYWWLHQEEKERVTLADLSPRLQAFAFSLIDVSMGTALAFKSSPRGTEGATLYETLFYYETLVLQALEILPADSAMAAQLFARYELNDLVAFEAMEGTSGYRPFFELLVSAVPMKWKVLADQKMRELINGELEGRVKPRTSWEGALPKYLYHIGFILGYKPYDAELLASQVKFVLELPNPSGRSPFGDWPLGKVLVQMSNPHWKDLRYRLARSVLFGKHDDSLGFRISDEGGLAAANWLLADFGDTDEELKNCLEKAVADYWSRVRKNEEVERREQERLDAVMAQMK